MEHNIDEYSISRLDFSELRDYVIQNGIVKQISKKEYLVRQDEKYEFVGFVSDGMFRYIRTDSSGKEHIVGYSFTNEFVAEYTSNLCNRPPLASIQAIKDSTVHLIKYTEIEKLWNSSPEKQRMGRIVAEQLFAMTYRRLIDSYCNTPEERYIDLMNRYPNLKELVPLKEIASFIGVTPETVSSIRKKLLGR